MQKQLRVNNQIRIAEVQVIDDNGDQLGKMRTSDALNLAHEKDLDLVEVAPNLRPPIAKIMDYGKYIYQKEKQEKKQKAKQKDQNLKTVRIGFKTGEHDLNFKSGKASKFLKEGHPVRVEIILRGRERSLADMARSKVEKFIELIQEPHSIANPMRRSPRGWTVIIQRDKR